LSVLAGIREYFIEKLGVDKATVNGLYEYRSKLVHGAHDPIYVRYSDAADHVATIRPMLERLLCLELGVPHGGPFFVEHPDHVALHLDAIMNCPWREDVYDLPAPLFQDIKVTFTQSQADSDANS
jgi:hypothetical protein